MITNYLFSKIFLDSKLKNVKQGVQKVQAFALYVVTVNGKYAKPRLKKEGLGVKGGVFVKAQFRKRLVCPNIYHRTLENHFKSND